VISDTHGLLREAAALALRGSDVIVHAGDVGGPEILERLREIAPVVAVRGNVDSQSWALALPVTQSLEADGTIFYVIHNLKELDLDPVAAEFGVVISGHTHKPIRFEKDGVLYINPGSAGPRRFSLPTTLARLRLGKKPWQVEFVPCGDFE
jgi:putative phosphoesterase